MRTYHRLRVRLIKQDRQKLDDLLSRGIQLVRVVLRALALCQLHDGKTVSEVAANIRLTPKAVREIGCRYEDGNLERALYDKQRPGAKACSMMVNGIGSLPWSAVIRPKAAPVGQFGWW